MKEAARNTWTTVIGLEVHVQLLTRSKIYSSDPTAYGAPPNTQAGVVTLGHPGTLPKLNRQVVELAVMMGLACDCRINPNNIFDRKNYFYPDLPKGYQITQDRAPLCVGGQIEVRRKDGTVGTIRLRKIHIEEDAGKLIHRSGEEGSKVDFNRAGVPLIEIVTEPDLRTSEDAFLVLVEIRRLVRYLGISDGNMEEGSLRCDANVSVMPVDSQVFGKKVEVKNMNSMRNVQRAIDFEAKRQIEELEAGREVPSETRSFDPDPGTTFGLRSKEELNDYRYFPDPDLSPVIISDAWLAEIRELMPALPKDLLRKFVDKYKLPAYDAAVLTDSREIALYFEEVCQLTRNFKAASNWVMGPVKAALNEGGFTTANFPLSARTIADLIGLVDEGSLSFSAASQRVFPELVRHPEERALAVANRLGAVNEQNKDAVLPLIEQVIDAFPAKVAEYRKGKKSLLAMFMGEVMRRSNGRVDPRLANELLTEKLEEA